MNILSYLFRETQRSLRQEWKMVSISTLSIGITLFFFSLIAVTLLNLAHWVSQQEKSTDILVYAEMALTPEEEEQLAFTIIDREDVASLTYVTRDEGYEQFKQLYGSKLLNAVEDNPFPVSFIVTPIDNYPVNKIPYLASTLQLITGVDAVHFSGPWIATLQAFHKKALIVGSSILLILFVAIFFAIKNTVQLTVFARRDLIRNMQFVGASPWRIRGPYLLEGMIEGGLGALVAWLLLFTLKTTLFSTIIPLWPQNQIVTALLLSGAILGSISGYSAIRPFVR